MSNFFDDSQLKYVTVYYFRNRVNKYVHGPVIAPDSEAPDRKAVAQPEFIGALRSTMLRINPNTPDGAIEEMLT